ncbi:MAG TPA: hypothetical protein VGJ75_07760, partial [Dongiaceae bacterium]
MMTAKTWKLSLLTGAALALGAMPCYAGSATPGSAHAKTVEAQETAPNITAAKTADASATGTEDTDDGTAADTGEDAAAN